MSIKLMSDVWTIELSHAQQAVMLALADFSNDDGDCWPSVGLIAWKTSYSERQTQRVMQELIDAGLVAVIGNEHGGRGKSRRYRLHLEKGVKKSPFRERATSSAAKGDAADVERVTSPVGKGDVAMSPESSREPSDESSPEPSEFATASLRRALTFADKLFAHAAGRGVRIPRKMKQPFIDVLKELFADGFTEEELAAAADDMFEKGYTAPNALPPFVTSAAARLTREAEQKQKPKLLEPVTPSEKNAVARVKAMTTGVGKMTAEG